jgi:hypothetical protein
LKLQWENALLAGASVLSVETEKPGVGIGKKKED